MAAGGYGRRENEIECLEKFDGIGRWSTEVMGRKMRIGDKMMLRRGRWSC